MGYIGDPEFYTGYSPSRIRLAFAVIPINQIFESLTDMFLGIEYGISWDFEIHHIVVDFSSLLPFPLKLVIEDSRYMWNNYSCFSHSDLESEADIK